MNWHEAVLLEASVAVQVTVVVPTEKLDPDGGVQLTTTPPQLSFPVGVEKVTVADPDPGGLSSVVIFAGQDPMVGSCVSLTVTVKLQDWSGLLPFDPVQVTVAIPTANVCGDVIVVAPTLQVTVGVGHPEVAVGAVNDTKAEH